MGSGYYHTAQICSKCGRVITDNVEEKPETLEKFCTVCGGETVTKCPSCDSPIRGLYRVPNIASKHLQQAPSYCHNCGKPYPWTQARAKIVPPNLFP